MSLGQHGYTFNWEVLAASLTWKFDANAYSKDAIERAKFYVERIPNHEVGAYTAASQGYWFV